MKKFLLFFTLLSVSTAFAQKIRIEDNKLALANPVTFKSGTAELLPESEETLKSVKAFLDDKTFVSTLRVEGHIATGDAIQAQSLSELRAKVVVAWLVKAGVDCKRLMAVGFGNTKPIVANDLSEKGLNNRIVFAVAALRGHAIGGMPVDGGGNVAGEACD